MAGAAPSGQDRVNLGAGPVAEGLDTLPRDEGRFRASGGDLFPEAWVVMMSGVTPAADPHKPPPLLTLIIRSLAPLAS